MSSPPPDPRFAGPPREDPAFPAPDPRLGLPTETKKRPWGAIATGGALLLLKGKSLLALLKFASLGKFALTSLSMLAMIWVEAQFYGWAFGVGFVLLILLHELGHGYAIKKHGLAAGWPVFIPFFGAAISLRGAIPSAAVGAEIAYGGPLAGTAASLACAGIHLATGSRLFLALASTGFFLNLFNMIPLPPLDGGRIAIAFSRRAWIVGGVLLGAMYFVAPAPQLLLIGFLGLSHMFRGQATEDTAVPLTPEERTTWTVRYFGLSFFLAAGILVTRLLLAK
jgi:Zn-dependent protease